MVEYLKIAIRRAADAGAPVVNSDERPKPLWTTTSITAKHQVDWNRVIDIVKSTRKEIVFSVECGTVSDAIRSFEYLEKLI